MMFVKPPLPEAQPHDLDQQVDWLTYDHPQLYRMVHEGVDLDGATDVSARWSALGEDLEQLSTDLAAAVAQVEQAWEGPAADSARESVNHLVGWTKDTAVGALEVSGCVTREINNLAHARRTMPLPPVDGPVQPIQPITFNGNDFVSVAAISSDNTMILRDRQEAHKQAAHVMQQFQSGSNEVYGTVPQFSSPYRHERSRPKPPTHPVPDPQPTPPQSGGGDPVATPTRPAPTAVPFTSTPSTPETPGGHGAGTAAVTGAPARAVAADEHPERSSGQGRSMGMMPGMGGGGARGEEDKERKSPKYVEADDDIWGSAGRVAPPVIGEPDA